MRVGHVCEDLVLEQLGEYGGAFRAARRTKRATATRKSYVELGLTDRTPSDGEARFEQSTIQVGDHGAIPATLPETVLALETLFPHGFDGFVVGLEVLE